MDAQTCINFMPSSKKINCCHVIIKEPKKTYVTLLLYIVGKQKELGIYTLNTRVALNRLFLYRKMGV